MMSVPDGFAEYEQLHEDPDAMAPWLDDPDLEGLEPGSEEAPAPRPAVRKRRTGATAAMFTALAMAYREVFEPEKGHEIVMEVEADEPFRDGPIEFILEPGNPRAGRIIVRPVQA